MSEYAPGERDFSETEEVPQGVELDSDGDQLSPREEQTGRYDDEGVEAMKVARDSILEADKAQRERERIDRMRVNAERTHANADRAREILKPHLPPTRAEQAIAEARENIARRAAEGNDLEGANEDRAQL